MAMILEFRARHASAESGEREETPGAQIIIFPGIRRERHTATATAGSTKPARRSKARPKRDRLELPD
jgi:hypothetical protein